MAINSPQDFATAVLSDLGAPVTANNVKTLVDWIAAENPWPPPRNNPLNNGLGSGGGSGLGSYPSLEVAAQYVAQNLSSGNYGYPAVVSALKSTPQRHSLSRPSSISSWAGGHYQGTDYGAGYTVNGTPPAGGGGGGQVANVAQAAAPANASLATSSDNIGGVSYVGTQQQTSALSTISANLATYGFTPAQISQLTGWAWGEITNNVDPTQIAIDLQAQPAFLQQFPGFASANAELNKAGLPAVSVQQYQQYQTQAQAMAQAAGLPAGFINSENIGTLIGGNVSTAELSSRLNNAMTLAINSTPEQQAMFNQYFGTNYGDSGQGGLTAGQIAAIALDPSVAEPLIAQQITAAQIGGASVTSGVGALQKSTATQLAQAGITESQATSAFQQLAPYSALETPRPGMHGEAQQGTVSADQLATGNLLGNPAAQRQQQTAIEVAKAPFTGGGGYVNTPQGAGVGSAGGSGTGNT